MRLKVQPNKLFETGPDWEWDDNLKHWVCTPISGFKAFVWTDWVNPPDNQVLQVDTRS